MEKKTVKQTAIQQYFLEGNSLTVLKCIRLFHTTELRKDVCRMNKKLIKLNYDLQVVGRYLDNDDFKTYKVERL